LGILDQPPATRHDLLGAAQHVLLAGEGRREQPHSAGADPPAAAADPWSARASALVAGRGWCTTDDPLVGRLADQLRAADAAGIDLSEEHLSILAEAADRVADADITSVPAASAAAVRQVVVGTLRSEEHTSELQSRFDLVCRLLLEKKKKNGEDVTSYNM